MVVIGLENLATWGLESTLEKHSKSNNVDELLKTKALLF